MTSDLNCLTSIAYVPMSLWPLTVTIHKMFLPDTCPNSPSNLQDFFLHFGWHFDWGTFRLESMPGQAIFSPGNLELFQSEIPGIKSNNFYIRERERSFFRKNLCSGALEGSIIAPIMLEITFYIPGSAPGCRTGNREKLSSTQAEPVQAIKSGHHLNSDTLRLKWM